MAYYWDLWMHEVDRWYLLSGTEHIFEAVDAIFDFKNTSLSIIYHEAFVLLIIIIIMYTNFMSY